MTTTEPLPSTTSGDRKHISNEINSKSKPLKKCNTLTASLLVQCQVCGQDGLCNGFEDNGQVEDCPIDHACFFVSESKKCFLCKLLRQN